MSYKDDDFNIKDNYDEPVYAAKSSWFSKKDDKVDYDNKVVGADIHNNEQYDKTPLDSEKPKKRNFFLILIAAVFSIGVGRVLLTVFTLIVLFFVGEYGTEYFPSSAILEQEVVRPDLNIDESKENVNDYVTVTETNTMEDETYFFNVRVPIQDIYDLAEQEIWEYSYFDKYLFKDFKFKHDNYTIVSRYYIYEIDDTLSLAVELENSTSRILSISIWKSKGYDENGEVIYDTIDIKDPNLSNFINE